MEGGELISVDIQIFLYRLARRRVLKCCETLSVVFMAKEINRVRP